MGKLVTRPDDCMDYKKIEYTVTRKGGRTELASGDHRKAIAIDPRTGNETTMIYCARKQGKGLACKIFKWLKYVGFVLIPLALIFLNQVLTSHPELLELK